MNGNKVVKKCCICGREQTEQGWQYAFRAGPPDRAYSHGFCSACYNAEIMKAKLRQAAPAFAGLR